MSETQSASQIVDPFRDFNFRISIADPQGEAHFTQCSGLGARIQTIRYREAGQRSEVRVIPGQVEYPDVTLQFGMTNSPALWNWVYAAITGQPQGGLPIRRHVSVYILNADGSDGGVHWDLINAFPCEWHAAPLNAMGQDAAIGKLVLSYDKVLQVSP
jgi:phage tail-like protein